MTWETEYRCKPWTWHWQREYLKASYCNEEELTPGKFYECDQNGVIIKKAPKG